MGMNDLRNAIYEVESAAIRTEDVREGTSAFLENRKPEFQGR